MTKSLHADRDTLGTIALDALNFHHNPVAGDLGHELMPSLVDDLNESIQSNPYNDQDFYITIHEKKDLQLKNVILRRMVKQVKRPYPEPNTSVFWTSPKTHETRFCWALPHITTFPNYLMNPDHYEEEQINDIRQYLAENMAHFGFQKVGTAEGKVPILEAIPRFKDRKMGKKENNLHFKI